MDFLIPLLLFLTSCAGVHTSLEKASSEKNVTQKVVPEHGNTKFQEIFFAAKKKVEAERYGEAKPLLEEYIRKSPSGMHVDQSELFLGQLAFRDKKFPLAETYFNRIIMAVPPSPLLNLARYNRARVWDAQGKKLEAVSDLGLINDREGIFPETEKLKLFMFWGHLASEEKQYRDSALAYKRSYQIAGDLKNASAQAEAHTQLEILIQKQMTLPDLETFLKYADTRTVPGAMAQKRYDQLKILTEQNPSDQAYTPLNEAAVMDISRVTETFGEEGKIGLLFPVDNNEKAWGKAIYEGMQLALKNVGSHLQLIPMNPGTTAESAKQAFDRLVQEYKVMVVVGPLAGDQAQAVAKRAEATGVPFFSTSPRTSSSWGATTINFSFDFKKQSEALAKFAHDFLNASRYAMIFPRDDFGKGFAESFYDSVLRRDSKFTAIESFPDGQTDFKKVVENMVGLGNLKDARVPERDDLLKDYQTKVNRPLTDKEKRNIIVPPIVDFDVLFIPDSYKVIGQLAPLLAYYDIEGVTLMGPSTWNSPQVLQRAGQFLEESVFVDFFSRSSPNEVVKEFLKAYENEYGKVPGEMGALGYDLASSLDRAMKSNSSSRKDLLKGILSMGEFVGVLGLEKWDEKRDPISEVQVFRIKKSNIVWQQSIRIR